MAHYKDWYKNISKRELRDGRRAYSTISILPTDGRQVINKNNITKLMYSFWTLNLMPLRVPPHYVLFWMVQSGKFAVSSRWAATTAGHGLRKSVLTALWVTYLAPEEVTIEDIEMLFYAPERDRNRSFYSAAAMENPRIMDPVQGRWVVDLQHKSDYVLDWGSTHFFNAVERAKSLRTQVVEASSSDDEATPTVSSSCALANAIFSVEQLNHEQPPSFAIDRPSSARLPHDDEQIGHAQVLGKVSLIESDMRVQLSEINKSDGSDDSDADEHQASQDIADELAGMESE
jgi:hypothetical protein